ncbi:mCG1051061 [Mus musculus]|nr:mCG1051061 [Mus musculus]
MAHSCHPKEGQSGCRISGWIVREEMQIGTSLWSQTRQARLGDKAMHEKKNAWTNVKARERPLLTVYFPAADTEAGTSQGP